LASKSVALQPGADPAPSHPEITSRSLSLRIACLGECMVELAPVPEGAGLFRLGVGGDSFNTAAYLARLADDSDVRISYVTALGQDTQSDRMIAAFREQELDTDLVFRIEGAAPGLYLIETDAEGERRFHYWRGQSAARQLMDGERAEALARALAGFDLVYLTGISLAILAPPARARLFDLLERLGPKTRLAFDPNHRPALWDRAAAVDAATRLAGCGAMVLASVEDARALFGDTGPGAAVRRWLDAGAAEVVLRRGAAPCCPGPSASWPRCGRRWPGSRRTSRPDVARCPSAPSPPSPPTCCHPCCRVFCAITRTAS